MDLQYMCVCSEAVCGPAVLCALGIIYKQTRQYQNEGVMTSSKHCQTGCSSVAEGIVVQY